MALVNYSGGGPVSGSKFYYGNGDDRQEDPQADPWYYDPWWEQTKEDIEEHQEEQIAYWDRPGDTDEEMQAYYDEIDEWEDAKAEEVLKNEKVGVYAQTRGGTYKKTKDGVVKVVEP